MNFSPFSMLYHTNEGGREALEQELMRQYRLDKLKQEETYQMKLQNIRMQQLKM